MSDEGEKTCPLCAEEMDLTDQQLKPCKCGYEICVWCWHHIMDMAEKDQSEGRCPACRTPYNKEKVVGPGANCGRLVSEVNTEKKLKSQKGKSKTVEGRNKLGSVRVIQRNLVYVVGLPLDFADEDLLQGRDYFNQYGKVMKVSISRTSAGAIQQFANSTCSVYITYSKEEEAVRCIQSVHGFILDGRPLKACFGTTKYCHAWLRNMPCSNPDCLYLHEVGTQEDSFTKDEIISAYTRNRVQHITGSSYPINRRSGNVLPAPADEYCNNCSVSSGKPTPKSATNTSTTLQHNSTVTARVSPPSSSSGRSTALPAGASWGARPSSSQPLPASAPYLNGPVKQKPDTCNTPVALSTAIVNPSQISSLHIDIPKKPVPNEGNTISHDKSEPETSGPVKVESDGEARIAVSESSFPSVQSATVPLNKQTHTPPIAEPRRNTIHTVDASSMSNETASDVHINSKDGNLESICSGILSTNTHEPEELQNGHVEGIREPTALQRAITATSSTDFSVAEVQSDSRMGVPTTNHVDSSEIEDDLLSFHSQRVKDPEVATDKVADYTRNFYLSKHSFHSPSFDMADGLNSVNMDRQMVDRNINSTVSMSDFPMGHRKNMLNGALVNDVEYSNMFPSYQDRNSMPHPSDSRVTSETLGVGESSIISNILSLNLNSWDDSLTSPHNLSKLWGETDNQGSFGVPGPRKLQNSNQSRFSFAREQEPVNQTSNFGHSANNLDQVFRQHPFGNDFSGGSNLNLENFVSHGGFPGVNSMESDIFASNHSHISSNKNSVSRSQISVPPGFSVPSRAPPPGFTSHERTDQTFNSFSANHMLDTSSLLRNQYQTYSSGSTFNNDDIEFIDPAILEVGKGILAGGLNNSGVLDMRSSYTPQSSTYEEARFQSLLQRSLPQHQNQRFSHNGDMFSQLGDAYGIPSRVMEQHTSLNRQSPYSQFSHPQSRTSNGQWDGWNEIQGGNNLSMAELLRSERLGFNNFGGYEDSKLRMPPSSGNLYNGTYGI